MRRSRSSGSRRPSGVCRARPLGLRPGEPVVGTVGRLDAQKGITYFLRAAALVLRRRPDVRFVIAGDGPLLAQYETEAHALGIADRTVFAGFCEDLPLVQSVLDVQVFASLWEGTPLTLSKPWPCDDPSSPPRWPGSARCCATAGKRGWFFPATWGGSPRVSRVAAATDAAAELAARAGTTAAASTCGARWKSSRSSTRAGGQAPVTSSHPSTPQVLYVGGWGRSGSTLLDLALGQIPGFVSVGELRYLWERPCRAPALRMRAPGAGMPLLGRSPGSSFGGVGQVDMGRCPRSGREWIGWLSSLCCSLRGAIRHWRRTCARSGRCSPGCTEPWRRSPGPEGSGLLEVAAYGLLLAGVLTWGCWCSTSSGIAGRLPTPGGDAN